MSDAAFAKFLRAIGAACAVLAHDLETKNTIERRRQSPEGIPGRASAHRKSEADQVAAVPSPAATRDPSQSIPPGSAAEYTLPPGMIVIRGTGNVVDEAALRADWLMLSTAAIMAKHKISEPTLYALRKRLALPDRPKGPRHGKPANGVRRAAPVSAAWAKPEIGGGNFVPAPTPRQETGLPAAGFDETLPTSIDNVILFLRQRDVIVARLPDGRFRIDGRRNVDRAGLLDFANDKRALMKKPPFALEG